MLIALLVSTCHALGPLQRSDYRIRDILTSSSLDVPDIQIVSRLV